MIEQTYLSYRKNLVEFLLAGLQKKPDGGAGWGLTKSERSPPSPTNTAEALEIALSFGVVDTVISVETRTSLLGFLYSRLKQRESLGPVRTREISMTALALHFLGDTTLKDELVKRLVALRLIDGWPVDSEQRDTSLIATFQAVKALHMLGAAPGSQHIDWLGRCQRPDDLCSWTPEGLESDFGASCLALYVMTISSDSNHAVTSKLAKAVHREMVKVFPLIARDDFSWVKQDPHSGFTVFGYGHGLMALANLGFDPFDVGAELLRPPQSTVSSGTHADKFSPYRLVAERTWVPAVLEYVHCVETLRSAYDPFAHLRATKSEGLEKQQLMHEHNRLKQRELLVDLWEKQIIRDRIVNQQQQHNLVDAVRIEIAAQMSLSVAKRAELMRKSLISALSVCVLLLVLVAFPVYMWGSVGFKLTNFESWWYAIVGATLWPVSTWVWQKFRQRRKQ